MCFPCAAALTKSIVRGTLIHQDLLSRIGQGQLSLLYMEPPHYGPKEGPLLEWIRQHQEMSMLEPRGTFREVTASPFQEMGLRGKPINEGGSIYNKDSCPCPILDKKILVY